MVLAFIRTWLRLPAAIKADFIFIHREVVPVGPPLAEWILAKIFRKKIIYDFDDAIWMTDKIQESFLEKIIRWRSKVESICKWSYKVSCGNAYLADYAKQFNTQVIINPTTIDTHYLHNPSRFNKAILRKAKQMDGVVIGWTGSHSTLKYLEEIESVLIALENENPKLSFIVIADKPPTLKLKRLTFCKWSKETEISDLMLADIGIMPLPNNQWANGKCGFKALQYMALGIPAVVSPVGVNTTIITHGSNGFCCSSAKEWNESLVALIHNTELRNDIGVAGKERVMASYSVSSNSEIFRSLFL